MRRDKRMQQGLVALSGNVAGTGCPVFDADAEFEEAAVQLLCGNADYPDERLLLAHHRRSPFSGIIFLQEARREDDADHMGMGHQFSKSKPCLAYFALNPLFQRLV